MTPKKFRELALSLPEAVESGHASRPDYRVREKVFATLFPEEEWAVIKLPPEVQVELRSEDPQVFERCKGAWGRSGATIVLLKNAKEDPVFRALIAAWRKYAPVSLTR